MKKSNLLKDVYPELADEWDFKLNSIDIGTVSCKSGRKVHWICSKDPRHQWESVVAKRTAGQGCPYCNGKKALPGVSSLKAVHPDLMKEWDWEKNSDIDPDNTLPGSAKRVYWICSSDSSHRWDAKIYHRTGSGSGCHYCTGQKPTKNKNTLAYKKPEIAEQWDYERNFLSPEDVTSSSSKRVWWVCPENPRHSWESAVYSRRLPGEGCPKCNSRTSKGETELAEFISEFFGIHRNTREIISPFELDIYIPEKKLAIEFNGIFWHSSLHTKDKDAHRNKVSMCAEQGVRLITVWEDDWKYREAIVRKMLKHKLGISTESRVYARKTVLDPSISQTEAIEFQEKNHIQGSGSGSLKIGLRDHENSLVALCVFKKRDSKTLELVRYCTLSHVIGGQSKILKWVDRNINYERMVTFADLSISDGSLYTETGWKLEKELDPDYMYVVGDHRKHKYGYRLKRFRDDPNLKYIDGYTESQLAELNSLHRIYDCGKIRYGRVNPKLV